MTIKDIAWLAGLLEGEGSFPWHKRDDARIKLAMTDADIVERAADIMGTKVRGPYLRRSMLGAKPLYECGLTGSRAIGWMLTLWPLMGRRRQTRIGAVVSAWKTRVLMKPRRDGVHNSHSVLDEKDVRYIRSAYRPRRNSYQLAEAFGVSDQAIRNVARRITWRHVP